MKYEREKPAPEPAPEVRDDPRVVAHRCPFCHEPVRPDEDAWVACARCLGRQHAACWDEAGRCPACRHDQRLEAPPRAATAGRPRDGRRPVHLVIALLLVLPALALLLFGAQAGGDVGVEVHPIRELDVPRTTEAP